MPCPSDFSSGHGSSVHEALLRPTPANGHALAQRATCSLVAMPRSDQLARVAVSPETWMAFRQAALTQGVSVAAYLGRLVEGEVQATHGSQDRRRLARGARARPGAGRPGRGPCVHRRARRDRRPAGALGDGARRVVGGRRQLAQAQRPTGARGIRAASVGPRPERPLQLSTSVVNSAQLRPSRLAV